MGVYEPVNCKIEGQIKPVEEGRIFWAELELLCAKYDLDLTKYYSNPEDRGVE